MMNDKLTKLENKLNKIQKEIDQLKKEDSFELPQHFESYDEWLDSKFGGLIYFVEKKENSLY